MIARGKDGTNGFRCAALFTNPVVEIRRKKTGLVPHVIAIALSSARSKEEIEAFLEVGCSAGNLDESANVLRNVKRIGPGRGFIEVVLVPRADEMRIERSLSIVHRHDASK